MTLVLSGTGRVSIFDLVVDWETQSRVTVAHTTAGFQGTVAALGIVPRGVEEEPADLFGIADQHADAGRWRGTREQQCGFWLVMLCHGAGTVPRTHAVTLRQTEWSLAGTRHVDLESPLAGYRSVVAGRMAVSAGSYVV